MRLLLRFLSYQRLFYTVVIILSLFYIIQENTISRYTSKLRQLDRYKAAVRSNIIHNRPSVIKIRPSYVIGVLTSQRYLATRAVDVYNTWGKGHKNISFFVGETNISMEMSLPLTVLKGANDSQYPPQSKGFGLLQYWCEHQFTEYDWFIKADDDTYMKNLLLKRLLLTLDPTEKYYIGRPGRGWLFERLKLGLYGNTFCSGPTVIYSRSLLSDLCPHIESCMKNVTTPHEDTEIGRCVIFNLGFQCAKTSKWPPLSSLFYQTYEWDTFSENMTQGKSFQPAISVHAVKESSLMFNLHYYYKMWLRKFRDKLQRNISAIYKKNPLGITQVKAIYKSTAELEAMINNNGKTNA